MESFITAAWARLNIFKSFIRIFSGWPVPDWVPRISGEPDESQSHDAWNWNNHELPVPQAIICCHKFIYESFQLAFGSHNSRPCINMNKSVKFVGTNTFNYSTNSDWWIKIHFADHSVEAAEWLIPDIVTSRVIENVHIIRAFWRAILWALPMPIGFEGIPGHGSGTWSEVDKDNTWPLHSGRVTLWQVAGK